jgi:tryptophan 7-halogenase
MIDNSSPSTSSIHPDLQRVVIVGGGTAGWMTAAALSRALRGKIAIELIESEEIGTVGVGEATIPMINLFNKTVGLDEDEFVRETHGTFKLGIEFVNWGKLGERYIHGFGRFGQDLWMVDFYQYWLRMYLQGKAPDIEAYSINRMACKTNKFMRARTDLPNSPLGEIAHAFHFDAGLYAKYLRKLSEAAGVVRTEGKVQQVHQRNPDGFIEGVTLESGKRIDGDLFIDCSGFRGLLIEQTLKTGYEDWTHHLPCDRALAVPCESSGDLLPYTRATAHKAGWQWRIGLQHRTGNGHVYCSQHISDDEAAAVLLANLDGKPLADPRPLKFQTGVRKKLWNKNVVAIGLSSGFMEPLESTSIHLIQSTIARLIAFFPNQSFNATDIAEFNDQADFEFRSIRDFLILHYHANQRTDSQFWLDCQNMAIPATLQRKIDLWKAHGRLTRFNNELFAEVGWLQVLHGQNVRPHTNHPLANMLPESEVHSYLESVRQVIEQCVQVMPKHADFVAEHCAMQM